MSLAALYDIHANLPALEAVISELREAEVDQIVVGGDVVPGPFPGETLDRLVQLGITTRFIHGNGDREVLAQMSGIETKWYRAAAEQWREPVRWTAEQLRREHRRLLASWPPTCQINLSGFGDVLFCHATPRNDTDIFTRITSEDRLLKVFDGLGVSLVLCGHTHMQFDRLIGRTRVVNAGSLGMPFGKPGAYWVLLGADLELRRTEYDRIQAAARIANTTYPQAESFAKSSVLEPRSEAETLQAFAVAELK